MAQQHDANESTPLLSPPLLPLVIGQEFEEPSHGTTSLSLNLNPTNQPNSDLFILSSSTSSGSSAMMQADQQNENMPLSLAESQDSTMEQQHEAQEPISHSNSPRVEHETQFSSSDLMHVGTEQQHERLPSLAPSSGEASPNTQQSVGNHFALEIAAQQFENKQQHQPFSLSGPTLSSIMLRRSVRAESASTARSSNSERNMKNINPRRVEQFMSTLDLDDDLRRILCKLVIATAPFHNTEPQSTPPARKASNPQADALRKTLGGLLFQPKSSKTTTAEKDSIAGNTNENPTGNLLFDTNAADDLGSRQIESRSDSPPLLWSTAAVEESLDPNAEEPKHYTIAEFVNTIIEKRIQVKSVTEEDWLIEEVRVGILNHLMNSPSEEDHTAERDEDEAVGTMEEVPGQTKPKKDTAKSYLTVKGRSNEALVTKKEPPKQAQAKEDTSKSDLQRWKEQGPDGWLKRDDGTDMNEEEIDEECARWDAMVTKARNEKEAEKAAALLGNDIDVKDKGFWEFVRSSKQKEQSKHSISTHSQDEQALASTHDQDEETGQKKNKKGSRKNKNKNRKAKKNALKGGDLEDLPEVCDAENPPNFLDLPTQVRKKVLGFILVVDQELVPYHYVKGKIVKNVGLRKKPELNILLALCSSKDKKVKKCLDDAKNVLYRDNTFSIRNPNELILILGTIGGDNMARMKMGQNLLLSDSFFHKKRQYELEMKWLARWGEDLLLIMKGRNIFRLDIVAASPDDDLTCEPTEVEKALTSMVEAMKDEGKRPEMLKEFSDGGGISHVRLRSLDLGERFGLLAAQIETMGLPTGDGKVTTYATLETRETNSSKKTMESMSEKKKRKALETGKQAEYEGKEGAYNDFFLQAVKAGVAEDEEDTLSQASGFYSPSLYSEPGEAGRIAKAASDSSVSLDANSGLVREILGLMDA